jgi:uncharacterized membrane protein
MRAKEFINLDIKNEGFFGGAAVGGLAGSLAGGEVGAAVGAIIGGIIGHLQDIKKTKQELQNLQAATASLNVEKELLIWKSKHNEMIQKNKEIIDMILKIPNAQIREKYLDKSQDLTDIWVETDPQDDDDFEDKFFGDELAWREDHDLKYLDALSQILLEIKQVLSIK